MHSNSMAGCGMAHGSVPVLTVGAPNHPTEQWHGWQVTRSDICVHQSLNGRTLYARPFGSLNGASPWRSGFEVLQSVDRVSIMKVRRFQEYGL